MGTLVFVRPGTRQTVSTGIEIDPAKFLFTPNATERSHYSIGGIAF
jgi:hypothetical protein